MTAAPTARCSVLPCDPLHPLRFIVWNLSGAAIQRAAGALYTSSILVIGKICGLARLNLITYNAPKRFLTFQKLKIHRQIQPVIVVNLHSIHTLRTESRGPLEQIKALG